MKGESNRSTVDEATRERRRQYSKVYREKNRDKIRAYMRERMARYRAEQPERVAAWKRRDYLRRKCDGRAAAKDRAHRYSVTVEEAMEMAARTHCDLCGKPFADGERKHLDHDHRTGRVRGMLHGPCNTSLGVIEKRGVDVSKLAEYLARFA